MRRNSKSRNDIKLGIVFSMVVVLTVGGYYVFRSGKKESPIPVTDLAASKPGASPVKNTPAPPAATPGSNRFANNANRPVPGSSQTPTNPNRPALIPQPAPVQPANSNPNATGSHEPNGNALASRANQPQTNSMVTPPQVKPEPSRVVSNPTTPSSTANAPLSITPNSERIASAKPPESPKPAVSSPPAGPSAGTENRATPSSPAPGVPHSAAPSVASNDSAKGFDLVHKPDLQPSPSTTTPAKSLTAMPSISPSSGSESSAKGPAVADNHTAAVDTHRVQQGDTFVSLAKSYYGSARYAKFLKDANPTVADGQLTPGTAIKIPPLPSDVDKASAKNAKTTNAPVPSEKSAAATGKGGKRTYTAKSGDSLYKIAKDQLGSSQRWKDLFELNKAALHNDPTQLRVGQTIVLPET